MVDLLFWPAGKVEILGSPGLGSPSVSSGTLPRAQLSPHHRLAWPKASRGTDSLQHRRGTLKSCGSQPFHLPLAAKVAGARHRPCHSARSFASLRLAGFPYIAIIHGSRWQFLALLCRRVGHGGDSALPATQVEPLPRRHPHSALCRSDDPGQHCGLDGGSLSPVSLRKSLMQARQFCRVRWAERTQAANLIAGDPLP